MDTLIAVGTSAAYFYSVAVRFLPSSFINNSVYYDTSTMIIALILFGKYLEAKARAAPDLSAGWVGPPGQDRGDKETASRTGG